MAKRVTYLIGAGASANALPVVNGMNERMEIFIEFLENASIVLKLDKDPSYRMSKDSFSGLRSMLNEIRYHYTVDTYAKRLYLLDENDKLERLKMFLSGYLIFEQFGKKNDFSKEILKMFLLKYGKQSEDNDNKLRSLNKIIENVDYRYDSIFANLLSYHTKKIDSNINFVSWNYDNQFEIAYSNYRNEKYSVDEIQRELQVIPSFVSNELDPNKSSIVKLNGTAGIYDQDCSYGKLFDFSNHLMNEETIKMFIVSLMSNRNDFKNNIKFAWENDEEVIKAREYARRIISESDVVVIIGYSFPTFNREVDRQIFSEFDSVLHRPVRMKIYIQDTKENAPKIKERLKAIGNNLYDVAEVYDDIDQFLIPYEL